TLQFSRGTKSSISETGIIRTPYVISGGILKPKSWNCDGVRSLTEYVFVELGRGNVGGLRFGLCEVTAYAFSLPHSPSLPHSSSEKVQVELGDAPHLRDINLSKRQGAAVIAALAKHRVFYMWDNATESAQRKLGA